MHFFCNRGAIPYVEVDPFNVSPHERGTRSIPTSVSETVCPRTHPPVFITFHELIPAIVIGGIGIGGQRESRRNKWVVGGDRKELAIRGWEWDI